MRTPTIATGLALSLATPALAQFHEGDILFGHITLEDQSTQLSFAESLDEFGFPSFGDCLFTIDLGTDARTTNPGFDSGFGAFNLGRDITFDYLAALRRWDGSSFETIPDEYVIITRGPTVGPRTPETDQIVAGFPAGVGGDGEFHVHYTFRLLDEGNIAATAVENHGVYLLELRFRISPEDHLPSEPLLLMLTNQASEGEIDAAQAFAEDNIAWCSAISDVCVADVNGDGAATPSDFTAWLAIFNNQGSATTEELDRADVNGDGFVTPADFTAWLAAFQLGC